MFPKMDLQHPLKKGFRMRPFEGHLEIFIITINPIEDYQRITDCNPIAEVVNADLSSLCFSLRELPRKDLS